MNTTVWSDFEYTRNLHNLKIQNTRHSCEISKRHEVKPRMEVSFGHAVQTLDSRPDSGALALMMFWISLNFGCSLSATSCRRIDSLVVMMMPVRASRWETQQCVLAKQSQCSHKSWIRLQAVTVLIKINALWALKIDCGCFIVFQC